MIHALHSRAGWGAAIYVASTNGYEDQIWLSGGGEEVYDIHISPITPEP